MKSLYALFFIFLFTIHSASSQSLYFPPNNATTWDTLSPASLGWCTDKIDTLFQFLDQSNSKAFILLKDGKIVLEKYFDSFTRDSLWYWASAGKTLTSFTVGIAKQEGKLQLNDTTSTYLGKGWTIAPPVKEALITIKNQLSMTSGLDDGVPDHYCTIDTCLIYKSDAGTRWAYHNGPYTLLDKVIENATGSSLNTYFNAKIKGIIGMKGAFLPQGYNNVYFSDARSMARFGLLILNKGNWNGTQIMTDTTYFREMVNTSNSLNLSYGYLWWLNGKSSFMLPQSQFVFTGSLNKDAPNDMFAALGKNGQLINVVPSMNMVFIRMGDSPGGVFDVAPDYNNDVWKELNKVICNATSIPEGNNTLTPISFYPNPADKQLIINYNKTESGLLYQITDLLGRTIMAGETLSNIIDISNLSKGPYILRFITTNQTQTLHFQKI